jgi:ATP-dependent exoDNAse (exonuclease V) beta subunit
MWSTFVNCQRRAFWRYEQKLVPKAVDPAMSFGSVIHEALERWYRTGQQEKVQSVIDRAYPDRDTHWHYATAMLQAYVEHYRKDDLEILLAEQVFNVPMINPDTDWPSRTFRLAGKIDAIAKQNGERFIVEHKTASQVDESYIERRQLDMQTRLYILANQGPPICGAIHNILVKPSIRQWQASKSRKVAETNEHFRERLLE